MVFMIFMVFQSEWTQTLLLHKRVMVTWPFKFNVCPGYMPFNHINPLWSFVQSIKLQSPPSWPNSTLLNHGHAHNQNLIFILKIKIMMFTSYSVVIKAWSFQSGGKAGKGEMMRIIEKPIISWYNSRGREKHWVRIEQVDKDRFTPIEGVNNTSGAGLSKVSMRGLLYHLSNIWWATFPHHLSRIVYQKTSCKLTNC